MTLLSLKDRSFWFKFSSISDDAVGWRKHGIQKEDQGLAWIKSIELITYVHLCLLITLPCSPGAELRRVQLTRIGRMPVKGASKAAAKRPCMIPEHSSEARCYWLSVDFRDREKNRTIQRQTLKSGWDRLKLSPRAIAQVRGANVEHNAYQTSPGKQHRDTRMITRSDINPAQQDLTSVLKPYVHTASAQHQTSHKRFYCWRWF